MKINDFNINFSFNFIPRNMYWNLFWFLHYEKISINNHTSNEGKQKVSSVPKTYAKLNHPKEFQIRCKKCRKVFTPTYRVQTYTYKCMKCLRIKE